MKILFLYLLAIKLQIIIKTVLLRVIKMQNLQKSNNNLFKFEITELNLTNKLGGGSLADVYKITDLNTNKQYAIKCFHANTEKGEIDREIEINKKVKEHSYIVMYHGLQQI